MSSANTALAEPAPTGSGCLMITAIGAVVLVSLAVLFAVLL